MSIDYILTLWTAFSTLAVLVLSLNLLTGLAGRFSAGHVALAAVGGYALVLSNQRLGIPIELGMVFAGVAAGTAAYALLVLGQKVSRAAFIVLSVAFHMTVIGAIRGWTTLTNGSLGLYGLKPPLILGMISERAVGYALLSGCLLALTMVVSDRIINSRLGLALNAMRDNATWSRTIGIGGMKAERIAAGCSGFFAGASGALSASMFGGVSPDAYPISEAFFLLMFLIVGGSGNLQGPLVGSLIAIGVPEILIRLPLLSSIAAEIRLVLFGAIVLLLITIRPQGIAGTHKVS